MLIEFRFKNYRSFRDEAVLSTAQLQILRFWSTLADETDLSEEKRRFLAIWKTLGPVYARFRERLSELGIAYNGMVQRAAADRIRGEGYAFPEARQYVVAGFNALSECEKQLFRFLSTAAEPFAARIILEIAAEPK